MQGRKDSQVKDADCTALKCQRVAQAPGPQSPTENEQHQRAEGDAAKSKLNRDMCVLGEIAQQKSDPEEQHDDAGAHKSVATGEVVPQQCYESIIYRWLARPLDTQRPPVLW